MGDIYQPNRLVREQERALNRLLSKHLTTIDEEKNLVAYEDGWSDERVLQEAGQPVPGRKITLLAVQGYRRDIFGHLNENPGKGNGKAARSDQRMLRLESAHDLLDKRHEQLKQQHEQLLDMHTKLQDQVDKFLDFFGPWSKDMVGRVRALYPGGGHTPPPSGAGTPMPNGTAK